jgi:hypothetical protein
MKSMYLGWVDISSTYGHSWLRPRKDCGIAGWSRESTSSVKLTPGAAAWPARATAALAAAGGAGGGGRGSAGRDRGRGEGAAGMRAGRRAAEAAGAPPPAVGGAGRGRGAAAAAELRQGGIQEASRPSGAPPGPLRPPARRPPPARHPASAGAPPPRRRPPRLTAQRRQRQPGQYYELGGPHCAAAGSLSACRGAPGGVAPSGEPART